MLLPESDAVELRKWIIKKLEALEAVADEDVLADFVIALLRTDTPEAQLRVDAYQDLEDFLKENTKTLVDDVFLALQTRSFLPSYVPPPVIPPTPAAALPKPVRSSVPISTSSGNHNGSGPKKRSYSDLQENGNAGDSQYGRVERQAKQMRRGGRGRGGNSGRGGNRGAGNTKIGDLFPAGDMSNQLLDNYSPMPFDPKDPFAAMAALQALNLPGMPQLPQPNTMNFNNIKERCRHYDTVGFCARGNACPYQHGQDHMVFPGQDEYDPKNAMLTDPLSTSPSVNGHNPTNGSMNGHSRGLGKGKGDRGGFIPRRNNRAEFSLTGPNNDRSITTIVVEQIPEEKFDERSVRDFFSEFGSITEVTMQPYKHLALVKYDDYFAARRAYDSPKVIFENRFVKVYWYKPGSVPSPSSNNTVKPSASSPTAATAEEQSFDREAFERKSLEAQKRLEEKKAQAKEMAARRAVLEKQKEELAQKQAEEKQRLLERLKEKSGGAADAQPNGDEGQVSESTKLLRAKLAELEAEAKSLGIDHSTPEAYSPRGRGRGRGRGSYRGWEGFAGRGSYDPYRGSLRGRGAFRGYGGGKYNLDLRTKKICVSGVEWTSERDEALRQHLLGIGEFEAIAPHLDSSSSTADDLIITFKDRPTAESFFYASSKDVPGVGKVERTWYNTPSSAMLPTNGANKHVSLDSAADGDIGDVRMTGVAADGTEDAGDGVKGGGGEMDYDVAEEDDRWN